MRKLRIRLTLSLLFLVIITSLVSLGVFISIQSGRFFNREAVRFYIFGYAVKDVVLLILAAATLALIVFVTAKRNSNPIIELTNATKEIIAGNFNVQVEVPERVMEIDELAKNFNIMAEELRGNVYLKENFVSSVSHQFKTPLSVIRGYSRLLEDGELDEQTRREYAAIISRESDRLIKLTRDMLSLARIDHQLMPEMVRRFSLDEQIRQVILLLEKQWSDKEIDLFVELTETEFTGEEELVYQIWVNLLDNAIKFTPRKGRISVIMECGADEAAVRVINDGSLDENVRGHMFERFYKGNSDGFGLGLAIVKRIVEIHRGRIEVNDENGVEFTVRLPLT